MRKTQKSKFLLDKEKIVGIDLGADFCAEHEWGIEQLRNQLGIPKDPIEEGTLGLDGRKTKEFPSKSFAIAEVDGYKLLVFHDHVKHWNNFSHISEELRLKNDIHLSAAWDESSFAIAIKGKEDEFLRRLFAAFEKKDVAIWLGGGGIFANAGLVIVIASLISAKYKDAILKGDEKRKRLADAVLTTGIKEKLDKVGKGYFAGKGYLALSPRWTDDQETSIEFWLNPCDQQNDNYGWFTLQNILDWIEGKGPIPKK